MPQAVESRLSLERIESATRAIDPVFLDSPQFESERLGSDLGMQLILKVETMNPIGCFKGRGTDFLVASLPASTPPLVAASAGNFGQGLAYAARKRGLRLAVFAAETANPLKLDRMRRMDADVRLHGPDFDAAKQQARAFAEATGACFVEDGREPAISEGAGTIAVELCRRQSAFDAVLVPLGDGALLAGIGRWMKAHSPATRIVGVCPFGAPAFALSLRDGSIQTITSADTIADGIAVRNPVPEAVADVAGVIDEVLLVDDGAMIRAMQLLFRHHGLVVEPSGAAGLAAAITYPEKFRGSRVALPLTGGNLTVEQMREWLCC